VGMAVGDGEDLWQFSDFVNPLGAIYECRKRPL